MAPTRSESSSSDDESDESMGPSNHELVVGRWAQLLDSSEEAMVSAVIGCLSTNLPLTHSISGCTALAHCMEHHLVGHGIAHL